MAELRACPRCHKINEGTPFCDQCGRAQPRTDSPANLHVLRAAVVVITIGIGLWTVSEGYNFVNAVDPEWTTILWQAGRWALGAFALWVQRELLKVILEIRARC